MMVTMSRTGAYMANNPPRSRSHDPGFLGPQGLSIGSRLLLVEIWGEGLELHGYLEHTKSRTC